VKKGWMLVLLISLGLNVGLGLRMVRQGHQAALLGQGAGGSQQRGGQRWERPAPSDTTAWRQFMGRRIDQLTLRLDLRPEQVDAFKATQQKSGRLMRQKRRELFQTRTRLQELMVGEGVNRPDVRRMMVEMAHRQVQMDSLAAEILLSELDILDSDQRVKYLDFLPDGPGRHQGRGRRGRDLLGE